MGKALVSNITVSSRSRRRPKSPCYGPFVGSGYPARDPSSTPLPVPSAGTVLPHKLAPYCYFNSPAGSLLLNPHRLAPYCYSPAGTLLLLTGWHPTATHRLAPYCYSPAGTLLLIIVGWHPLCSVAPLAPLPLRSFGLSSVTPSRGIALPPWLCPTLGNDVMTCPTVHHGFWWALNL